MVYSPSPSPPRRPTSLTQLMAEAGPSRRSRPETIPNSCSEDSDSDDEPLPIPIPTRDDGRAPVRAAKGAPTSAARKSITSGQAQQYQATPTAVPKRVNAVMGSNGRMVYQAVSGPREAFYYVVQWRKPQQKKHKTWDGDAYLRVEGQKISMVDEDGKHMATGALAGGGLPREGQEFRLGNYDTEVDREITFDEFRSITSALGKGGASVVPSYMSPSLNRARTAFKTPTQVSKPRPSGFTPARDENEGQVLQSAAPGTVLAPFRKIDPGVFYGNSKTKAKGERIVIGEKSAADRKKWGGAAHDPQAENAVVMKRPPDRWAKARQTEIVDVVIDPLLSCMMRDHQKKGVQFMYECVMGMTKTESYGCILADEMGLGKTLQTIALIWTLLSKPPLSTQLKVEQSPFADQNGVIGRAMIVVPVTLVDNWRKEFRKWTSNKINVVVADGKENKISAFIHNKSQHVLIIGYERLRKDIKHLKSCVPPIDLIVCDEGHRLKSKDNKTTKMFEELKTARRIILSGTPVQNDLGEYWAMANFVCPGVLGKYSAFNRQFEKAILKSRAPGCSKMDLEEGMMRAEELGETSNAFLLRRTAAVLDDYLPSKHEYVLFVAPSALQLAIMARLLDPAIISSLLRNRANPLGFIDTMRKVCNSPSLLKSKADKDDNPIDATTASTALKGALQALPSDYDPKDPSGSGKLSLLVRMLKHLHSETDEKVVVVSNWTSTLDVIRDQLDRLRMPHLRLDGSTSQKARQGLVDQFNRSPRSNSFVFLLSAKAGGTGLNLIGASRLILFDSDWNPSTDLQAMARIHRDGQKKPVFIYRLLTTNTIDEKIYQRQITKTGLSDQMLNAGATGEKNSNSFSDAELRDLFTLALTTDGCQTHDLLECNCINDPIAFAAANVDALGSHSPTPVGDSDDESQAKFVSAAQYDPEPTPRMQKKMAEDKQAKLAALKKWTHMSGFDNTSYDAMADNVLHDLISEDRDRTLATANADASKLSDSHRDFDEADAFNEFELTDDAGVLDVALDQYDTKDLAPPKRKRPIRDPDSPVPEQEDEINGIEELDGDLLESGSDQVEEGGRGRKRGSETAARGRNADRRKKRRGLFNIEDIGKKYNLRDIANNGGGGRVMFMFEKISRSKPVDKKDEDEETSDVE